MKIMKYSTFQSYQPEIFSHPKTKNNWVIYRDFSNMFKVCSPRRALKGRLGNGLLLRLSNPI